RNPPVVDADRADDRAAEEQDRQIESGKGGIDSGVDQQRRHPAGRKQRDEEPGRLQLEGKAARQDEPPDRDEEDDDDQERDQRAPAQRRLPHQHHDEGGRGRGRHALARAPLEREEQRDHDRADDEDDRERRTRSCVSRTRAQRQALRWPYAAGCRSDASPYAAGFRSVASLKATAGRSLVSPYAGGVRSGASCFARFAGRGRRFSSRNARPIVASRTARKTTIGRVQERGPVSCGSLAGVTTSRITRLSLSIWFARCSFVT